MPNGLDETGRALETAVDELLLARRRPSLLINTRTGEIDDRMNAFEFAGPGTRGTVGCPLCRANAIGRAARPAVPRFNRSNLRRVSREDDDLVFARESRSQRAAKKA